MDLLKIIQEGRVDDFKSKYGNKFGPEQLKRIVDSVPHKYLTWVGKTFDGVNFEENFPKLYTALNKFTNISTNLPKTDINQYQNLSDLLDAISVYENRERRDVKKVEGGNVVYDDGKLFVVNPLDYKASCYYGKGTKWCTAAETDTHFKKYNEDGKLFYIIDRTKPTSDPLYKVAFLRKFDGEKKYFDAKDEYVKSGWIFATDQFNKLDKAVDTYLSTEFGEQIKIFTDIELAKKEKERLRKLEIQRILNQRRQEAQERRLDGEWDLSNPNIDEFGLKANALLEFLIDNGEAQILTNEQKIEIQRIKDQIEQLNTEYDNSDDVRTDLLNQIEELEDDLEDYDAYIDVYNIIPVGQFYDTTEFEVIDSDVDSNRYAVGTEGEMQSSCEEYIENLIDDIGYEGFSSNFAKGFLDDDAIVSEAEDIYDNDVRNNPESYFDDSDRMLSDAQEERVRILEYTIEKVNKTIEQFESMMDGDNDEAIESKIEELQERLIEYNEEIEEIKDDPEGEFPDELIDDKVSDLVDDVRRDPEWFLSEYGLNWDNYINKNEFIQGVIDADGYGHTINSYDGSADEVYVNDQLFYVMRID
jgi:phage shock protein A